MPRLPTSVAPGTASIGPRRARFSQIASTRPMLINVLAFALSTSDPMERTTFPRKDLRIAAIGDIHVSKSSQGMFQPLFSQISSSADVLLLCGDFTDYGLPEEARILARELTTAVK